MPKGSIVKNKADLNYNPIGHVQWMMDKLIDNFKSAWSASDYLCVDECMVAYNRQYCSFKQYLLLKLVIHGIKIWYLACLRSKYIKIGRCMFERQMRWHRGW